MMFGKKKAGAIAAGLSLVMALSPVAALADAPNLNGAGGVKVTKVMQANTGSSFSKTFTFSASRIQLTGTSAAEKNTTPEIASVSVDETGAGTLTTDAFGFANAVYPHAGVYGYEVKEVRAEGDTHLRADQRDLMTYDDSVYTVYVWVVNKQGGGTEIQAVTAVKGTEAQPAIPDQDATKSTSLSFTNSYWEYGNPDTPDNKGVDLKVDKVLSGNFVNTTADWHFNVSFDTTGLVMPEDNVMQYQIVSTGSDPVEADWKALPENGKYTLKGGQQILFKNVVAGTKYTVTEDEAKSDGYGTEGEVKTATTITDQGNSATVTNTKNNTVVTGVIVNNAPFIVMIGAAAAGVVAYGSAKRKLEK